MTNYNTTIKIPVQLSVEQIGLLLGCMDAVKDMGYLGSQYEDMTSLGVEMMEQAQKYLNTVNTIS